MYNTIHRASVGSVIAGLIVLLLPVAGLAQPSLSRSLTVSDYQRIHLKGNARVRVTQVAAGEDSVTATGDASYLEALEFDSADNTLFIDAGDDHPVDMLVIHLHVSKLTEIVSEGQGEITVDGLTSTSLALEGRGAGRFDFHDLQVNDLVVVGEGNTEFQLHGAAENQFVDLAGAGRYQADSLASETSQINVRGSGQVALNVRQLLDVSVIGIANIRYLGSPIIRQQVHGTGRVNPIH